MNEAIYVVLSRTPCECTLCHRWYDNADDAAAYVRRASEETGCELYYIRVERGTNSA